MMRPCATPGNVASPPLWYLPQPPSISTAALLVVAAAFIPAALGHDHDSENIQEGEAMSVDPIVCGHPSGMLRTET